MDKKSECDGLKYDSEIDIDYCESHCFGEGCSSKNYCEQYLKAKHGGN